MGDANRGTGKGAGPPRNHLVKEKVRRHRAPPWNFYS